MKPDWDELGEKFENSKKVLIGDVDCTLDVNKALCEEQGVEGYPTIKYYTPGTTEGTVYEGERDLKSLKKFCKTLGPACSRANPKRCKKAELEILEEYMKLSDETLQQSVTEKKAELAAAQEEFSALQQSLQSQYEAASKKVKDIKEKLEPEIKLMKGAMQAPA